MLTERLNRFFKSDEEKAAEAADEIVSLLKDSPQLELLRRERDDRRLTRLRELLAQRDQINQDWAAAVPALEAAILEAQEKERLAHEALQAATRERAAAQHSRLCASLDYSFNVSKIDGEIKKTAPQEIDDFLYEMLTADEKARNEFKLGYRPGAKARITGEVKVTIIDSNSQAVEKKRAYIKAAIAEAEGMKFNVIPADQITARLEKLKKGLPDFNRFETVEMPLADVKELRKK